MSEDLFVKSQANQTFSGTESLLKGEKGLKKLSVDSKQFTDESRTVSHIKDLLNKFEAPVCKNCPKRRADRVCVNKSCGIDRYLQLICGRCHSDSHSLAKNKPEIDIEEFFIKLGLFSTQKASCEKKNNGGEIVIENLQLGLEQLNTIREKLGQLKQHISREVEGYETPQQVHSLLQSSVIKALSLCEYENINRQLQPIKKNILFQKNKFFWNDASKKFNSFISVLDKLKNEEDILMKHVSKGFKGTSILSEMKLLCKISTDSVDRIKDICIDSKDEEIVIPPGPQYQRQFYLDFELDPESIYSMIFTFLVNPQHFTLVGILPKSIVAHSWMTSTDDVHYKPFYYYSSSNGCQKIEKGQDLARFPTQNTQIEMRIDMKTGFIDFSDFPKHKNINSRLSPLKKEPYVIVIALERQESIRIDSLQKIEDLENYQDI